MSFVAFTPNQAGIISPRWIDESKSVFPVILGGVGTSCALWFYSKRHILPALAGLNTVTLLFARQYSGITDPDRAAINADREARETKMTEIKRKTRKKAEADRLLLAASTSFVSGAWAMQFGMHVGRVVVAPPALAEQWKATAPMQGGLASVACLLMCYKSYVESQIAYQHRFDL